MTVIASLITSLGLESSSFTTGLKEAQKQLKATQKTFASVGSNMAKVGAVLSVGITAPFTALVSAAIPAAVESQQAMAQVSAALESMGPVAGRTAEQLSELAGRLQDTSNFDDDDILKSVTANLLKVVARFRGRPFDWSKRSTCVHLARAQMRALGHRPPSIPDFRSALGARAALRKAGYETIEQLLDSMLPRIAPAEMLVGDLCIVPGDGFAAIGVSAGDTLLMYHEDADGLANVKGAVPHIIAAWRL